MTKEPHYPQDAPVGDAAEATESEAAVSAASAKEVAPKGRSNFKAGVAVGIGSAAIVAALLYARSARRDDK